MKGQIKLNENELRNFISYSVAKLLKESRPIYFDHNGVLDYDGEEDDGSGYHNGVIKLDAFDGDYNDIILPVAKQLFGDDIPFDSETMDDDDDWFDTFYRRILDVNGIDDISVEVTIDDDAYLKDYKIWDSKYDAADPKLKKFMDIITKEILDRIDDGETIFFKLNPNLYESTKKIHISKDEISEMIRKQVKMIKENVDSLGQYHGALRVDQEGEFANKIFDLKRDIEDAMTDLEENGGEEDYNDAQYYLTLKRAYNALEDLVNFENEDY